MSTTSLQENVASSAVAEWLDSYLVERYNSEAASSDSDAKLHEQKAELNAESFTDRLNARFSELDLAPRDGIVTIFEIERAINNPLLHFDHQDIQMLKLMRNYYNKLKEVHKQSREGEDLGISRSDVLALAKCMDESITRLRHQIEEEYRGNAASK